MGGTVPYLKRDSVPKASPNRPSKTDGNASRVMIRYLFSRITWLEDPVYDANVFICTTTAEKKAFTVPSLVLLQLPLTPAGKEGSGALMVFGATQPTSTNGMFTAPLVKGGNIDSSIFQGTVGFMSNTSYQ